MTIMTNSLGLKHRLSLWCPQSASLNRIPRSSSVAFANLPKSYVVASSAFANKNREFVIVGGGNAAGYAARSFVEHLMADGRLCVVCKEAVAPYERPALTKGYLFPFDKNSRASTGGERQIPDWYKEHGIEMLYEDPVTDLDIEKHTLTTSSGKLLKYGSLIIATGCTAVRFPEKIGGSLSGVHYIRDFADADSLISSLERARKVVIVGGGYIAMEVAAAAVVWKLDITVDGQFRTSVPGIFAIGDVAAFPLKMYDRIARVEHVDHAGRSAQHCVNSLLSAKTHLARKVWWQFYGDNVGETIEIGYFDPKIVTFWLDSGISTPA